MARIEVEVVGKDVGLTSTFEKATRAASAFGKEAANIAGKTQRSFQLLDNPKFSFGTNFQKASKTFSTGAGNAAQSIGELSSTLVDAEGSFVGFEGAVAPIFRTLQGLTQSVGSTRDATRSLVTGLIGGGGLALAMSAVGVAILLYKKYQDQAKKATDEAAEAAKKAREEFLKSPYEKAATDLNELTQKVSLAKQGFLDKKAVLKEYNEGIGATIGKVTDLDAAETKLVNNGEKYLQLMLLKAKAEFAFKKAAEESYNLALKQDEIDSKKPQISKEFNINADRSNKATKETTINLRELLNTTNQITPALDGVNTKVEQISKNLGEQISDEKALTELSKNSAKAVDVVTKAQQEVIDFAKKNGFDLNGVFGIDNGKEKIAENFRGAQIEIERTQNSLDAFLEKYLATEKLLGKTPIIPIASFKVATAAVLTEAESFTQKLNEIINVGAISAFSDFGAAIGTAFANGGNVLEAASAGILSSIGDVIIQFGKLTLAAGVASTALAKALQNPTNPINGIAAIAAGVALIAVGAAVKGFSGNIGKGNTADSVTAGGRKRTPGFASGVTNFQGGMAYVHAGELLTNLPTGANVIPAAKTDRLLSGISGGGTFIADSVVRGQDIVISYRRTMESNGKI